MITTQTDQRSLMGSRQFNNEEQQGRFDSLTVLSYELHQPKP
jgi:hypothetical protein